MTEEIWCSPEYRVEERAKIFCSMVIIIPSLRIYFQTFLFCLPLGRLLFFVFLFQNQIVTFLAPPTQNIHYVAERYSATILFRKDTDVYIQLLLKLLTQNWNICLTYIEKKKKKISKKNNLIIDSKETSRYCNILLSFFTTNVVHYVTHTTDHFISK